MLHNKTDIRVINHSIKDINGVINSPVVYSLLSEEKNTFTGKGVSISVLDTGCPRHKDIKVSGTHINFYDSESDEYDKNGHSTMVSGVMSANNKSTIVGLIPHAKVLYGKVVDNKGKCEYNSLVAGILWSIVKNVDIIVISLGTQYNYPVLRDAIIKAKKNGICIFAASGKEVEKENGEADYPARYDEVFSVGCLPRSKNKRDMVKRKVDICLPNKKFYTTYLNNKYVRAGGSSMATAYVAGVAATIIEKYKNKIPSNEIPFLCYSKLIKHFE
jgi:subtilisin family serine protease